MRGMPLIIATDFDGTLCEHEFPAIGREKFDVVSKLKDLQDLGAKIILWTCRDGKKLGEAVAWCRERGLDLDAVNEDVQEMKDTEFGKSKSSKVFAHYYLDDRNLDLLQFLTHSFGG